MKQVLFSMTNCPPIVTMVRFTAYQQCRRYIRFHLLQSQLHRDNEFRLHPDERSSHRPGRAGKCNERYVEESSLAEVAERLGVQTGAVAMRLQRGKLALRRVLSDELAVEWQEYGVRGRGQAEWEKTSIWCTYCGRHHLVGRFSPAEGTLLLSCPACGEYSHSNLAHTSESQLFLGMKRVKPAVMRLRGWIHRYYRDHLDELMAPCLRCGRMVPLQLVSSLQAVDAEHFSENRHDERGVYQTCSDCPLHNWTSLESLALALPEGQRFYREHARIHTLLELSIEVDGRVAFVTRFESVTGQARFEVVSSSHRYEVVSINGEHR